MNGPGNESEDAVAESVGSATGHREVDAILSRVNDLERLPVSEHIAVFERIHRGLQNVLSDSPTDRAAADPKPADPSREP